PVTSIPSSTARSCVSTFIYTSRVDKLPRVGSRGSRVEQAHLDWLTTKLNKHFQIDPPPLAQRTVYRSINKLTAYTLKLMRVELGRYNDPEHIEGRRQWAENVLHGPRNMNHFVYIDEANFNLHITRKFYKTQKVQDAITTSGHTFHLLPSYSPHLNADESVFSSVETHVRLEVVGAETLSGDVTSSLAQNQCRNS
ncbi:hypothetical protein BGZ89_005771, partial [Linnemannia elongata]